MAYTQGITRDNLISDVLRMLGVLASGGTASANQISEGATALNMALKALDSMNIANEQTVLLSTMSITTGAYFGTMSAGVHSVLAASYAITGNPYAGFPLKLVPIHQLWERDAPEYGIPSRCAAVLAGARGTTTGECGKLLLDKKAFTGISVEVVYRQMLPVLSSASETVTLRDEYLRLVKYMTAVDLAGSYGLELGYRQELRAALNDAILLAQSANPSIDQSAMLKIVAASQGTTPPPFVG